MKQNKIDKEDLLEFMRTVKQFNKNSLNDLAAKGKAADDLVEKIEMAFEIGARGYYIDDLLRGTLEYPNALTGKEAAELYVNDVYVNHRGSSFAISIYAWPIGGEELYDGGWHTVVVHPHAFPCDGVAGGEHWWFAPHELVGGSEHYPGVIPDEVGSVTTVSICRYCAMERHCTSPTSGVEKEEHHSTIRYVVGDINELAEYLVVNDKVPSNLKVGCRLHEILVEMGGDYYE